MKPDIARELEQVHIPRFPCPWPEACAPDAAAVEGAMLDWAERHRLFADEAYRARVARTRYGWLAARCYPRADRALLQIIADYFVWYFLADDLFIDRVDTVTPRTVADLCAMIDVLDFDRLGAAPVWGESAWLDVCRRLRRRLPGEQFERFANGMRLWAATAGLQIINHTTPQSVEIRHYEAIRRHTSGMNPCLDLADVANAGPLAAADFYRPAVQRLRRHANNFVCWSNDIQSLMIEARQPGQYRNMVIIYAAAGRSLQEAVDVTAARVRGELDAFVRLAATVTVGAGRELHGFVTGLKDWMRGYQDWVERDTYRYARAFADGDADDRAVRAERS